ADGSAFTHAGSLGPGGQTSLHALFHQKTGSLHGRALLTPESINGIESDWFIAPPAKPRATGSYRQGIPLHSLSLHGGPWQPPAPGHTQLILLGGGLSEEAGIPIEITPALKTRVSAHPLALQITGFKPATGQWSGHFTLDGRKAPLHGLLLPGGAGHGHFLLPQAPAPGEKILPPWSGRARIEP
ncbi:MAG TPA: hypothetical protein PK490_23285, partial [Prosthecobacter sp.]|nr:hypothetical protein [Prosthecobacter sp.]